MSCGFQLSYSVSFVERILAETCLLSEPKSVDEFLKRCPVPTSQEMGRGYEDQTGVGYAQNEWRRMQLEQIGVCKSH